MKVREYGSSGPRVIVLHGGPGAPGHMAPVARGLADRFRVLEPWQRGSGAGRLSVAQHIGDLHELLTTRCQGERPALVGSSWGAMLALAHAAAHADSVGALVLVGCGTFDAAARERFHMTLADRTNAAMSAELGRGAGLDPDEQLKKMAALSLPLYSCDLITTDTETVLFDARAHEETWADMIRLQDEGVYPQAFAAIKMPVLMLHGGADPHPGQMIRAGLQRYLPQLEYREWERCGHYPWLERDIRDEFFKVLREWLSEKVGTGTGHH